MKKINQYEGFITSVDMYQCLLLACNDFTSGEMLGIAKQLEIDENQDFYEITKTIFSYLETLDDYYLSLTENNYQFIDRLFMKSKANRDLCKKYEGKLIEINQAKQQWSNTLGKTEQVEKLDQFVGATISFFQMVKEDFYENDLFNTTGRYGDYDDGVFMLLLPIINAGCRNCDFYRKEVLEREKQGIKTEYSISLLPHQKEQLNTKMKMKILGTINDNLEGLYIEKENAIVKKK